MRGTLITIIALAVLSACNPENTFERRIANNSQQAITIYLYNINAMVYGDSINLPVGKTTSIYHDGLQGQTRDNVFCEFEVDSMHYLVAGGLNLTKDLAGEDNWISSHDKKAQHYDCLFEITDSDLQ